MSPFAAVLCAALAAINADDLQLTAGARLVYRGGVAPIEHDRTAGEPQKTFEASFLVAEAESQASKLYWLVEEKGQGAWTWSERFGDWAFDAAGLPVQPIGPSLRFHYGPDSSSVVPLLAPVWPAEPALAEGAVWQRDNFDYEVAGRETRLGMSTWRINVKNGFGPKRSVWVEPQSRLVVSVEEIVFMNQGTEYKLDLTLADIETLPMKDFEATRGAFAALVELRGKLNRPARTEDVDWTDEQRALLAGGLPAIEKLEPAGALGKLVRAAVRDVSFQAGRADDIEELRQKYLGSAIEPFDAQGLGKEGLKSDSLSGKVTVLHFWDYKDAPLSEPYGQVGYLEFLYGKRHAEGVTVYGVAVNGELRDEKTRGSAKAAVRKLRSFMNLTYPQLLDDGSLLKQFGDPRSLGASLPLFVVIDAEGKIQEYQVGYYQVDDRQGLKALDAAVTKALAK